MSSCHCHSKSIFTFIKLFIFTIFIFSFSSCSTSHNNSDSDIDPTPPISYDGSIDISCHDAYFWNSINGENTFSDQIDKPCKLVVNNHVIDDAEEQKKIQWSLNSNSSGFDGRFTIDNGLISWMNIKESQSFLLEITAIYLNKKYQNTFVLFLCDCIDFEVVFADGIDSISWEYDDSNRITKKWYLYNKKTSTIYRDEVINIKSKYDSSKSKDIYINFYVKSDRSFVKYFEIEHDSQGWSMKFQDLKTGGVGDFTFTIDFEFKDANDQSLYTSHSTKQIPFYIYTISQLEFSVGDDGNWTVSTTQGLDSTRDGFNGQIVIPAQHKGKPVTKIDKFFLAYYTNFNKVLKFPDTINTISFGFLFNASSYNQNLTFPASMRRLVGADCNQTSDFIKMLNHEEGYENFTLSQEQMDQVNEDDDSLLTCFMYGCQSYNSTITFNSSVEGFLKQIYEKNFKIISQHIGYETQIYADAISNLEKSFFDLSKITPLEEKHNTFIYIFNNIYARQLLQYYDNIVDVLKTYESKTYQTDFYNNHKILRLLQVRYV